MFLLIFEIPIIHFKMNIDTKIFLKKKFKEFYWKNNIKSPKEIEKREFGIGTLESKIKVRHKSFKNERELNNFLKRDAPFFISYSAAYYEFPENQPMSAKTWEGADLIFDLDVDMDFIEEEKFERVKTETINLMDFLIDDFGFKKNDIELNFSGNKGYHIHISKPEVIKLGRDERLEIVDYITGTGFNLEHHLSKEALPGIDLKERKEFRLRGSFTPVIKGPTADDVGWGKRAYDVALDFVSSDIERLKSVYGIKQKHAERLYKNRKFNLKILMDGRWDGLIDFTKNMQQKIIEKYAIRLVGDTDRTVTIDTTRLIRLPDSLHGSSGFIAKRVRNIEDFDPLVDSLAFGDDEITIDINEKISKFKMNENIFGPFNKKSVKLPEYVAVYLLLKGRAEVV